MENMESVISLYMLENEYIMFYASLKVKTKRNQNKVQNEYIMFHASLKKEKKINQKQSTTKLKS